MKGNIVQNPHSSDTYFHLGLFGTDNYCPGIYTLQGMSLKFVSPTTMFLTLLFPIYFGNIVMEDKSKLDINITI